MDENKEEFTKKQLQRLYQDVPDLRKSPKGNHLTDLEMAKYLNESLLDREFHRIDRHLQDCVNCAKKLERFYEEVPVVITLLSNTDANVRKEAVQAINILYPSPTKELQAALISLLSDVDAGVQQVAAKVITTSRMQVTDQVKAELDRLLAIAKDRVQNIAEIIKSSLTGMVIPVPQRGIAFAADSDRNRFLQYGEMSDGAGRWSVEEDHKGNLIVRFSSYVVALKGTIIEVRSGDWRDKVTFDFVAPNQVGGKIVIPKNERGNMAKTASITIDNVILPSSQDDIPQ